MEAPTAAKGLGLEVVWGWPNAFVGCVFVAAAVAKGLEEVAVVDAPPNALVCWPKAEGWPNALVVWETCPKGLVEAWGAGWPKAEFWPKAEGWPKAEFWPKVEGWPKALVPPLPKGLGFWPRVDA